MTPQPDEPILFPDVEALIRDYLGPLISVPVSTRVPNPRPDEFVVVRRTGGPRVRRITDQTQLTIEYWAKDSVTASAGAQLVRAHINAAANRAPGVQRVQEFSGPANLPDPVSDQDRYTWTVSLDVRGQAL